MTKFSAMLLSACIAASATHAQPPKPSAAPTKRAATPYSMRGVELGITIDEFRALPIPPGNSGAYNAPVAACEPFIRWMKCNWVETSSSGVPRHSPAFTPVGDGGGYADFLFTPSPDGQLRLMRIELKSNMQYLAGMLDPFVKKYGNPQIKSGIAQNGYGASFSQQTMTWSNGVSEIVMETLCGRVDFLCLNYSHKALEAYDRKMQRDAKGDPADKL